MVLQIVQIVIAAATALLGVLVIVRPASLESFAGVKASGGRGLTEIRAGMGAFYLALGLAPIIFNSPEMYFLLGITYLVVGVVRLAGIVIDKSSEVSNWGSLASDLLFGIVLILPMG